MSGKFGKKATQMNFKKSVICFIIVSILLTAASSVLMYNNFHGRFQEWRNTVEEEWQNGYHYGQENDYQKYEGQHPSDFWGRGHENKYYMKRPKADFEKLRESLNFSKTDIAIIAVCGIIGMALGVWYWLLAMIWAYRKASRMGVNSTLWVVLALFFNLAAVAVLYIYALVSGTCKNCGKVRSKNGKFCDRCGKAFQKECPECGQAVDAAADYCSSCGKKFDADKK